MGGHAIADLLFGQANPSGTLPITFRPSLDVPPFDNESLVVIYDYFHGYRYLDRNGSTPEFPLGFGLSYTRFAIDNFVPANRGERRRRGDFSVDVTNTGATRGGRGGSALCHLHGFRRRASRAGAERFWQGLPGARRDKNGRNTNDRQAACHTPR